MIIRHNPLDIWISHEIIFWILLGLKKNIMNLLTEILVCQKKLLNHQEK